MVDYGRFMNRSPAPSRQSLEKTCTVIESSLAEMKIIVSRVSIIGFQSNSEAARSPAFLW